MGFEFSIESLDRVLDHPNIRVDKMPVGDELFDRIRILTIDLHKYEIKWYKNICYLKHGSLIVPFRSVRQQNTWPNNAKMNLQFYGRNNWVCCVLKIEDY